MVAATNIALPAIQRTFGLSAIALSWISLIYLLGVAASLVPFAKIADLIGRKRLYLWSWVVIAIGSLAAAFSPSSTMLFVARVVQGLGAGMIFSTGPAILTAAYPPNQRGRVLGINVAATYMALAIGPVVGGLLIENLGWRSLFGFTVLLSVVTFGIGISRLRGLEWRVERKGPFDLVGALLYVVGLSLLLVGFSLLPQPIGAILAAAGLFGTLAFGVWETRVADPVFAVGLLLRNRVFAFSNLAALINYSATFAVSFLLSLYLQYLKGLTAEKAGLILVAGTAVQAVFSPAAGRLSDRVEPRTVASLGMALCVFGLLALVFVGQGTGVWVVACIQCIFGLGFALFSSPNTSTIMGSVEPRYLGAASASVAVMRSTGMSFSMGITALVLGLTVGSKALGPAQYPAFLVSMRVTLVVFAALCTLGVAASLARGTTSGRVAQA